jgi:hypothetical protein
MAYQGEYFIERYGKEAVARTPPIRLMLAAGLPVGGTPMYPEQNRLDRMEALRRYTVGSSWFSSEDDRDCAGRSLDLGLHRRPHLVLADLVDLFSDAGVFPGVHRSPVDNVVLGKHRADLVEDRTGEGFLGDGGENRRDLEFLRCLRDQRRVVAQRYRIDRFGREGHLRLVIDHDQRVIAGISSTRQDHA